MLARMWDKQKLAAMLRSLDEDRRQLVKGQYQDLPGRIRRLNQMAKQLESVAESGEAELVPELQKVRDAAARNARLIKAVQTGIQSAEAKLQRLAETTEPLRTYTGQGTQVLVSTSAARERQTSLMQFSVSHSNLHRQWPECTQRGRVLAKRGLRRSALRPA